MNLKKNSIDSQIFGEEKRFRMRNIKPTKFQNKINLKLHTINITIKIIMMMSFNRNRITNKERSNHNARC